MQLDSKVFCHWDIVRFIKEENLLKNGVFRTLSVTEGNSAELMIFLGKADNDSDYEVRVYKNTPTDKYVPNECDNVKRYEENDDYATFIFEQFDDAHEFVDTLSYRHNEYRVRPITSIASKKE